MMETTNNRPKRKRLFTTHSKTAGTRANGSRAGAGTLDDERRRTSQEGSQGSADDSVWGEGEGDQHTASALEHGVLRPCTANGPEDGQRGGEGVDGGDHGKITAVRKEGPALWAMAAACVK